MTHTEALTMALELLAVATYHSPDLQAKRTEVIDAGLKALSSGATVAQPTPPECETEVEKIAFAHGWWKALETKTQPQGGHTFYDANGKVVAHLDATAEITMDYAKPSVWAKAEQSPVAKPHEQELVCVCGAIWKGQELICTPPPVATQHERTWVGLTDYERDQIWYTVGNADPHGDVDGWSGRDVMDAIEAKLKEKNT